MPVTLNEVPVADPKTAVIPEAWSCPPVMVSPDALEMPPAVDTLIPPANVDVAVEEELSPPAATRSPRNSEACSVEVAVINPNAGEVEAEVLKVCSVPAEDIERTFQSLEELVTAKVWVVPVSPLSEVIPASSPQVRYPVEVVSKALEHPRSPLFVNLVPPAMTTPPSKVEEAVAERTLRRLVDMSPVKVEVPEPPAEIVLSARRLVAVAEPKTAVIPEAWSWPPVRVSPADEERPPPPKVAPPPKEEVAVPATLKFAVSTVPVA